MDTHSERKTDMIEIYLLEQLDSFAKCGTLSAASDFLLELFQ